VIERRVATGNFEPAESAAAHAATPDRQCLFRLTRRCRTLSLPETQYLRYLTHDLLKAPILRPAATQFMRCRISQQSGMLRGFVKTCAGLNAAASADQAKTTHSLTASDAV